MSDAQIQRELGELAAKVEHLNAGQDELRQDVKAIRSVLDQSKGGVRVLLAAASVGGAVTTLLVEHGLGRIFK